MRRLEHPDTNLCSQHNMLAGAGLPSQGEQRHFITHKHGQVPLPWQVYWLAWAHLAACVWCSSAAIFEWFISKLFLKVRPDVNTYLFERTWLKKKAQRQHTPYRWKRWGLKSLSKEELSLCQLNIHGVFLSALVSQEGEVAQSKPDPFLCAYHVSLPGSNVAHTAPAEERAVGWTKGRQGHRQGDEPCPAAQDFVPEVGKSSQHKMQFVDVLNTHCKTRQVSSLHYFCIILILLKSF